MLIPFVIKQSKEKHPCTCPCHTDTGRCGIRYCCSNAGKLISSESLKEVLMKKLNN